MYISKQIIVISKFHLLQS